MRQRGRRSAASMAVAPGLTVLETRRPAPPAGLTEAETAVWRETVAAVPVGWFTKATYPVLRAFCRRAARAEVLAEQANRFQPAWIKEEGGLQRLDKPMRLTQQAQRNPKAAARAMENTFNGPPPWKWEKAGTSKRR